MQAVRFHEYGPPDVLRLEDAPEPQPGAGEVLVRVAAAGVNPIDWKLRAGYLREFMPVELPHTLGYDLAGTVAAVGPGVTGHTPGHEVFGRGDGAYAEYALAPAERLAPKPAGLGFDAAATLPVGGVTAWVGLFDTAALEAGQRLLVHGGAGGVGSFVVQLGRWRDAHVIATASAANADRVSALGADEVIDYRAIAFDEVVRDVDVVYDTVGGEVTERSWGVLRPGGVLVAIAGMADEAAAAAHGVRTGGPQPPAATSPILSRLAALAEAGDLAPQVGATFPLAEAAAAHALSETGHGHGRIVLRVAA
jgi:NADPH:quinone reductase-like Zn-dependent oxidoreductase